MTGAGESTRENRQTEEPEMSKKAKRQAKRTASGRDQPGLPVMWLVQAYKEAVDSTPPDPEGKEALATEGLLIAALATSEALAKYSDLWHAATYGDPPTDAGDEGMLLRAYEVWLDASEPLRERLRLLEESGYESDAARRFKACYLEARAVLDDARDRRELDRTALRVDQLTQLASKLSPAPASDESTGGVWDRPRPRHIILSDNPGESDDPLGGAGS
jgi:hypothetical protein